MVSYVVDCCWLLLLKVNNFGSKGCSELKEFLSEKLLGLFQANKYLSYFSLQGASLLYVTFQLAWYLFSMPLVFRSAFSREGKKSVFEGEKSYISRTVLKLSAARCLQCMNLLYFCIESVFKL